MSRRASIVNAFSEILKTIDGTSTFKTNLFNNSFNKLKFWDEINDFPACYTIAGTETREYLPGGFAWGYLNVCIKVYTKGEDAQLLLENLLEDIENVIDGLRSVLIYDANNNYSTSEISITSIVTDEGLLAPYGVGEITLLVRYQVM